MLFKSSFMKGNNMINFIIDYSKIISGICVILFGFAIIPITYMILEKSDTIIKTATMWDYFVWGMSSVLLLSSVLFVLFGFSLIEDHIRERKSYR